MTERSLGPLERRIMTHLWQTGTGTVAQVLAAANTGDARPLAYTTVMTVLVRLHEKGLVARVREGRQFRYAPAVQEDHSPRSWGGASRALAALVAATLAALVAISTTHDIVVKTSNAGSSRPPRGIREAID